MPLFPCLVLLPWFILLPGLILLLFVLVARFFIFIPGPVFSHNLFRLPELPPLLLDMLLIIPSRRLGFLLDALAGDNVQDVVLVGDGAIALGAGFGPRLAFLDVGGVGLHGYVEIAVLAIFGLLIAGGLVGFEVGGGEGFAAVRAVLKFVVLLVVLLLEVDVVHLMAGGAFFNVAPAVAEVGGHFGLGVLLEAVVAPLHFFR